MPLNNSVNSNLCNSNIKKIQHLRAFPETDGDEIVISGMAGKFPNCHNIAEFEYNLYNKIDMVDDDERRWKHFNPEIPKRVGKIYNLEKFDAAFFEVSFKQAHTLDPQTRILMESAYEAIMDAGVNPKSLRGTRTGVYIGACTSESEKTWFYEKISPGGVGITGCCRAMMANRISYALGLQGPSILLDSACSSSLYALDNAFSMLRSGEIDAAIVGGSNLTLHPFVSLQFARLRVLAPNGFCRPFDKDATGYTRSEAISCLFLQRKLNAKRVYATVVYSKTNCDGYKPESITHPSGKLQEQLLDEFYKNIDIKPNSLGYLEAHGTATRVGDLVECCTIDNVLCSQRKEPLFFGSVKSNMGHSEAASGICSLVKACLAFETGKIAPNINFNEIKPEICALVEGRLVVVSNVTPLPKPYIGINAFGFGGANAHVLLRGFDHSKINMGIPEDNIPRLLTWAGRTEESVNIIFDTIEKSPLDREFIALLQNIQKEDVSGMVFRGYGIFSKNGTGPAKAILRDVQHFTGLRRPVVWVFSGMGSQWSGMGKSLMTIPDFRKSIECCHAVLEKKGLDLINILTSEYSNMYDNVLHSFVAITAIQIGLVDVLQKLGLKPDYIIGHSVGELGCGYADGGLTLEQTILFSYFRGKVSLEIDKIRGSMAAIGFGYKDVVKILPPSIEVAYRNSANLCTISGPAEDVAKFVKKLKKSNIFAKEVPCCNIAYHSRYIAHMGSLLVKYLNTTVPYPKKRTYKWLSTSVPKQDWDMTGNDLCSAEYYTNNLISTVFFEETFALLPNNSLTIEIAPHGLLKTILKNSMPGGLHIALMQKGNKRNDLFFLSALGKLFCNGITYFTDELYPKVEFPVSRGTAGISSLVRWDHSQDWFVSKYENMGVKSSGERTFKVNLESDEEEYLSGHVIDGKILLPATCYIQYVWQTFSLMYRGPSYMNMPVEFEDIRFLRATSISRNTNVDLNVMIQYGTGNFEVTESGSLVVTGRIREIEQPTIPEVNVLKKTSNFSMLSKKDFYKELKLRGYQYNSLFCAIASCRGDGLLGKVEWEYNWVTFMDAMLQIYILGTDSRSLILPTRIQKLRINGPHHFDLITRMNTEKYVFDVIVDQKYERIICGGIELIGLHATTVQRRRPQGIAVLEKYQFLPYYPKERLSLSDAARVCIQLGVEKSSLLKLRVVEVDTIGREPIITHILEAIKDTPIVSGDFVFLTTREVKGFSGIHTENGKLSTLSNCDFIVIGENIQTEMEKAYTALTDNGFLIVRNQKGLKLQNFKLHSNFEFIGALSTTKDGEMFLLLQKLSKKQFTDPVVIEIKESDQSFKWIRLLQLAMANKSNILVFSYNENLNGLMGLVNCLRKEPDGHLITAFFIDDRKAPAFNITDTFYANQYALGLPINVFRNGQWGSYRHILLHDNEKKIPRMDHVYGSVLQKGDLSSLRWLEGPTDPKECEIKIAYSSLNFKDIMLATGRLAVGLYGSNRMEQNYGLGFEYSGINTKTGSRIMCMDEKGGIASYVEKPSRFIWEIPEKWSLEEAATVPVVYVTVYYAFFMATKIQKDKSILIHAGTGGIGMAAIRVALAYNLKVFTTCSTIKKKMFLLKTFPQLKESHIGNSRDFTFEQMIQRETCGNGVDYVLNSLSEDKLLASIRCLGSGGHFIEIGKFDMANDSKLGMSCFLKGITFHAVLADNFFINGRDEQFTHLKYLIDTDLTNGIIQPLPSTVFPAHKIEQAFRYLAGGKHIGKVLIQVRSNPVSPFTVPMRVHPQIYFKSFLTYVIPGGLGGFGLELADWMVMRGARLLVLSSSQGLRQDYQMYKIQWWKTYGCKVVISTSDISSVEGCQNLLVEAEKMGPIGGIFNLAVTLQDAIFMNQSADKFSASFAPKAFATKHLDELSRVHCPKLEHFVVFSSISCGRGNAGQTNYGMANSIMERIIEQRVSKGYPGKAIQWGAVGEVGLVAEMTENKIDINIGGTLQQRISCCLHELDTLLSVSDPLVSSMIVAEKQNNRSESKNIVERVMNIMGIRDQKSLSLTTTLSEMGMDSLFAVEIRQTLEREFELYLTPQDLRALDFQKLQQFSHVKESAKSNEIIKIFPSEGKVLGMDMLLRNFDYDSHSEEVLLPLNTTLCSTKQNTLSYIVIPGLIGSAGHAWYNIGSQIKNTLYLLQLHKFSELNSIKEIAESSSKFVKKVLKKSKSFYIIGYSYGSLIALQLTALLEKAGYRGQLILIDGAPHFLKKLTLAHLGDNYTDNDIYNLLLTTIVTQIFPEKTKESTLLTLAKLDTLEKKIKKFIELVTNQSANSRIYAKPNLTAMFKRVQMTASLDLESIDKLISPITLIRPSEVSLHDIPQDYCISEITSGKTVVKVIKGNHTTMLDNPVLPQMINDFDPALE